jgi:hypothetical protein
VIARYKRAIFDLITIAKKMRNEAPGECVFVAMKKTDDTLMQATRPMTMRCCWIFDDTR